MKTKLSAESVSALMNLLPEDARRRSGFSFDGDELTIPAEYVTAATEIMLSEGWDATSPATAHDAARAARLLAVDIEAERQRLRWITPGAGQAMTYARKVEEARLLTHDPDPLAYPMLAASIGIDGADLAAVATTILAMDAAWGRIGGAIEARRLRLKRDVAQAATPNALALIDITTGWPE